MLKCAYALTALLASTGFGTSPFVFFANAEGEQTTCPEKPVPKYNIDFADPETETKFGYELFGNARIASPAPDGVARALRIDAMASYANLPGVNISPSQMENCTLALGVYLERIKEGSKGWILTHDNGQFDRALVLHDDRFNGLGISTGKKYPVYHEKTLPETGKWIQIVATFRQGGDCNLFVDGVKAPITATGMAGEGNPDFQIGQPRDYPTEHDSDSWVRDVQIYDKALSDEEVEALFCVYDKETTPNINCGGGVTAHSCSECPSGTEGAKGCAGDCVWDRPPAECIEGGGESEEASSVDCGDHRANNCDNCDASGDDPTGCSGDCRWDFAAGTCVYCDESSGNCPQECKWDAATSSCIDPAEPVPAPAPAPKFKYAGGKFKQVSVDANGKNVWAINPKNKIFHRAGFEGKWTQVEGTLMQISVCAYGGCVWGVHPNYTVFYRTGLNGKWKSVSGPEMKQVSASREGIHVWGVDRWNQVWHRQGISGSWQKFGRKKFRYVTVSPNFDKVFGIDSNLYVWATSGRGTNVNWELQPNMRAMQLSSTWQNGEIWSVNSSKGIHYKHIGVHDGEWLRISPDRLKYVEVSSDGQHIWGINDDNDARYLKRYHGFWKD